MQILKTLYICWIVFWTLAGFLALCIGHGNNYIEFVLVYFSIFAFPYLIYWICIYSKKIFKHSRFTFNNILILLLLIFISIPLLLIISKNLDII